MIEFGSIIIHDDIENEVIDAFYELYGRSKLCIKNTPAYCGFKYRALIAVYRYGNVEQVVYFEALFEASYPNESLPLDLLGMIIIYVFSDNQRLIDHLISKYNISSRINSVLYGVYRNTNVKMIERIWSEYDNDIRCVNGTLKYENKRSVKQTYIDVYSGIMEDDRDYVVHVIAVALGVSGCIDTYEYHINIVRQHDQAWYMYIKYVALITAIEKDNRKLRDHILKDYDLMDISTDNINALLEVLSTNDDIDVIILICKGCDLCLESFERFLEELEDRGRFDVYAIVKDIMASKYPIC
jgi:hypothetical protein